MKFLFDLGGVFFNWDPNYFFRGIFENDEERRFFLTEVCNDDWNLKQDCGRTIKEAENEIIPLYPNYEKQIRMYYKNHRKMIQGTYETSIKVLRYLKIHNFNCYVLSNWSAETFEGMIEDYHFLKLFDGLLISGKEKLIKPDKAIYELAISRFKLIPKDTVFIDDKIENILAAKQLNFNTIHLIDPNKIELEIKKFIV